MQRPRTADPLDRIACWLDPAEFRSTWLANKAIYRTRMAVADGGELVVLAPGVARFGDDHQLDALIRRHRGGLTRDEIERVGFAWRPLTDERARLGLADGAPAGDRLRGETDEPALIANPALGLWTARELDDASAREPAQAVAASRPCT